MRTTSQSSNLAVRAPAALTAGVLALSAVLPPVALAEQDQTDDGTAAVTQNTTADPDQGASFDPGGDAASLPDAAPPTATASPTPLAAPDASDQSDPVVDPGDGSDVKSPTPPVVPAATIALAPTAASAEPQVPTEPQAPSAPPTDAPAADSAAPAPVPASVAPAVVVRRVKPVHRVMVRHRVPAAHPMHTPTVAAPVALVAVRPATVKAVVIPAALRAKPGDRTHTVRAGECLWMIATDLRPRATATAIGREVHRLWVRNRARIGTGDPDLLLIGTKLTLR